MTELDTTAWLPLALWLILGPAVGGLIGARRNRPVAGVFLGLLAPIGWLVIAVLPSAGPKCRYCGGMIEEGYSVCRHCGREVA